MKKKRRGFSAVVAFCLLGAGLFSCSGDKDAPAPTGPGTTPPVVTAPDFDIDQLHDTYASIAPYEFRYKWGPYNTHDPSIIRDGDYYYSYSTDAAFGISAPRHTGPEVERPGELGIRRAGF